MPSRQFEHLRRKSLATLQRLAGDALRVTVAPAPAEGFEVHDRDAGLLVRGRYQVVTAYLEGYRHGRAELNSLREFKDRLIDAHVVGWSFRAEHETDAKLAVDDLIRAITLEATDPAISQAAHDLVTAATVGHQATIDAQRKELNRVAEYAAATYLELLALRKKYGEE